MERDDVRKSPRDPARGGGARRATLPVLAALGAVLALGLPSGASAQQGSIGGVVVDAQTQRPLSAAQVFVVGGGQGALTNDQGRFLIQGVRSGPVRVQVTLIGYADASQEASPGDMDVRFELQPSAISLNALVVTGTPGATQKKAIGNVVSTLDAADIARKAPVADVQQVLNGRVAGVTVLSSTGEVGGASRIHIRGASTFSLSGTPLIYVDGVRVNNSEASGPINQGFGSRSISRLSDLDPDDIQSIEVIKGPAAATLYGTEAANGVIQIITKRGRQGSTHFTLDVKQGTNWFANPAGRLWTNWGMVDGSLQSLDFDQLQQNWIDMQNADGVTPSNIFKNGYLQSYDGSMSGGNEFMQYYLSASYEHSTGVEPTNKVRKGSGRLNLTVTPNERWKIDGNFAYILGRTDLACEAGCGGVTWTTYFMSPNKVSDPMRRGFWSGTPASYHALYWTWQDLGRFTGSVQINNDPTPWLSHRLTFGIDQTHTQDHDMMNHDERYVYYDSFADRGYADVVDNRVNYTTVDYSATFKFDLADGIHSNTSVGGQYYRRHDDYVEAYGEGFPVPGLTAVDATTQNRTGLQTFVNNTTVGIYGQEQLNWNDTRFLTIGLRADDNSAFGKDFNLVYYPKVSGAWVLSDESFLDLPSAVNTLRLRAAYGQSGQQPEQYAALRTFSPVTGPNDVGTVTPGTVGNPELGPERSSEVEVGFDAGFLEDRLGLEFTYFNAHTRDAILLRQIAPSSGFTGSQWVNAGRIDNSGFEFALRGTPWQTETMAWDVGFNLSTNHNEVVSLGSVTSEDFVQAGSYVQHRIGYPVGSWFSQRVTSATLGSDGTVDKASMMCDDGNGGSTACYDAGGTLVAPEVFLGRNIPKVDGGVNTTLSFGNLRLYGQVDFKTGYSKLDGNQRVRCFFFALCRENYVPEDYDPVDIAEIQNGLPNVLIHPASFAKLREVSATYDFPQAIAGRIGARALSLTVAGRNLATWTHYPGLEPEATFNGGSRGGSYSLWEQDVLPQLAQFVATLHVGF